MKIQTAYPVTAMDGKSENVSFFTTSNGIFARERLPVNNPNTPGQESVRSFVTTASRQWCELAETVREAWEDYGQLYCKNPNSLAVNRSLGLPMYVKANVTRQILGLGLMTSAPTEAPPAALTNIAPLVTDDERRFDFTLTHSLASVAGLVVLVKITGPMPTVARRPQDTDLRLIKGVGPSSSTALVASGGTVTFQDARFAVADGRRYGLQARIVRTVDGIASTSVFRDVIRAMA